MKITVIGTGHAGSTVAADLSRRGHEVTLLKTSDKLHNEHFAELQKTGWILLEENDSEYPAKVFATTDIPLALSGRDLIIVYIQTNYHEQLIQRISPYLEDGQTVLIEPGYLSTCYFLRYCKKDITIVEAESSPIDCRITSPGKVRVLFRNVINPVGVFPKIKTEKAKSVLAQTGFPFEYLTSVVEAALHNPNLIVHTIGAVFSTPRIEYVAKHGGDYSMYREVFTPHIWNLVCALDEEKMQVLEKLGCKRMSYVEACKHRNSVDEARDATEVFFDYAENSAPDGPYEPESRYLTEDVSQGLVLLESLGKVLSVPTPTCTALIDCASAMANRSFRAEGRTVEQLGAEPLKKILKKETDYFR